MSRQILRSVFGPQRVPGSFTLAAVTVIITQAAVLLLDQPAAYWIDPQQARVWQPLQFLLSNGPWIFAALVFVYIVVVILLLHSLKSYLGTVLVGAICFFHIEWSMYSLTLSEVSNVFAWGALYFGLYGVFLIPVVLALVGPFPGFRKLLACLKLDHPKLPLAVATLWSLILVACVLNKASLPESGWKPVISEHSPGPRSMAAVAYDTKRQRAVLFGGASGLEDGEYVYELDVWEWDGHDWTLIPVIQGPTGRVKHTMVYDEAREVVLLYGGENDTGALMDIWAWDGKLWTKLCPACCPSERYNHEMIYDTEKEQVIVYGGNNKGTGYHDAWAWDGEAWQGVSLDSPAPETYSGAMVYDPVNQQALSFIGESWGGTWVWKDAKWEKPEMPIEPPVRQDPTLVYDPLHQQSILFGGENSYLFYNDTWSFKDGAWEELEIPLSPPPRYQHVAFYDMVRGSIVIYGGNIMLDEYAGDMWELKLSEAGN